MLGKKKPSTYTTTDEKGNFTWEEADNDDLDEDLDDEEDQEDIDEEDEK